MPGRRKPIISKKFKKLELEVGYGENNFTMSRGSFSYRQRIQWRKKLNLMDTKEKGLVTELWYENPDNGKLYCLEVTDDEGISVKFKADSAEDINRWWITFPSSKNEHIYGCGETYSKLDLKGEKVRIWVAEHQNAARITKKILREKLTGKHPNHVLPFRKYESYYAEPVFVSSEKYFVYVHTDAYSEFDFSKADKTTLYLQQKPDFVVKEADSYSELSEKLSALLGHQRKLPDWIYDGSILAIQEGCEAVEHKLDKAFGEGVKVNGVWCQDWCGCRRTGFGYQVMWNWQADDSLYTNLKAKIAEWNEKGIHFLGYINPFIALEKNLYKEAAEKGYCVKDKDGKDYLVKITTFPAAMVDFTNPEAYAWYKNIIKNNMIGIGMSGWMADFGEYLPVDSVLYSGEDPALIHNKWPAMWAQLNKEAIEECGKTDEVFFFTRAGHTGTVAASSMMWTGDQHVDWSVDDGLPSVIPATLSLAMSGYGITHSDVGGYTTIMHMKRTKELLMRWEEMNVFSPLFRTHEGNQPVNDVQFDEDTELLQHLAKCSRIHSALKDYLKTLVDEDVEKGIPVMRPLFYHYDDEKCMTEKTEYLLGRDILVAPVLKEKASSRTVYLPDDKWIHLLTGKEYHGGSFEVKAPVGTPAVFIRRDGKNALELRDKILNSLKD